MERIALEADGRRRRSADSRRRIVDATIRLVQAGDVAPSADAVATEAGVGRRTVFRLFQDMDSIFREIQLLTRAKIAPIREQPLAGDTPDARLHALVDRRVRLFDEILPLTVAAAVHRPRSRVLQEGHAAIQAELRRISRAVLGSDAERDPELADLVDAVLSIDMWHRLRIDQQLDTERARAILHRLMSHAIRR